MVNKQTAIYNAMNKLINCNQTEFLPYFFLKKNLTTFLVITSERFLAVVSSPLPSSHVVYPVFFSKFTHKIN